MHDINFTNVISIPFLLMFLKKILAALFRGIFSMKISYFELTGFPHDKNLQITNQSTDFKKGG